MNLDFYKKQISELQYKISNITAELKAETLEKQALAHHQEQMKDNMKQAVQKQNILEQEIAHLKLTTERVCFTKIGAILGGYFNIYGHLCRNSKCQRVNAVKRLIVTELSKRC